MEYVGKRYVKLKEGIFSGPDKRKLLCNPLFHEFINVREKEAWEFFADLVHNSFGNRQDDNYKKIVRLFANCI